VPPTEVIRGFALNSLTLGNPPGTCPRRSPRRYEYRLPIGLRLGNEIAQSLSEERCWLETYVVGDGQCPALVLPRHNRECVAQVLRQRKLRRIGHIESYRRSRREYVHGLDIEIGLDVESVADYSRGWPLSTDRWLVKAGWRRVCIARNT